LINGYAPTPGDILYLIVGASAESGTFANQAVPDQFSSGYNTIAIGGYVFDVSYTANYNNGSGSSFTGGDDVALMAIAVPEPNTWMMLLGGVGVLTVWRRSRRLGRSK